VSRLRFPPGALEPVARARLDAAKILIVGSGGIGGTIAHEFARSGVASITLVDFDVYAEGNLNRQISCYADTIGRFKAEVLAEELRRIGTVGRVDAIVDRRRADGFAREIAEADFVVAAADDYAFSLALMDRTLASGKCAGAALPIGTWAAVAMFMPGGPIPASLLGFGRSEGEEGYAKEIARRRPALARYIARKSGSPFTEELRAFEKNLGRPPQLCPVVWSAASILVLEAVKLLAGFGVPTVAPRWFELTARGMGVRTSLSGFFGPRAGHRLKQSVMRVQG
jgi:molybdopterin/thiamine biosynthesis adenylyltransferase